jgi:hypothetical protein
MTKMCVQIALEGYSNAMQHGDAYDLRALLRVVHLWLTNSQHKSVNDKMHSALEVPWHLSMAA